MVFVLIAIVIVVAVATPRIINSVKQRIYYNSVDYWRFSGVMKSFEQKFRSLLYGYEPIQEDGLSALRSQVESAYVFLTSSKFPPLDDVKGSIALYRQMAGLVKKHDAEVKFVHEFGGNFGRLIEENRYISHSERKAFRAEYAPPPLLTLQEDSLKLFKDTWAKWESFDSLVDRHNADFVNSECGYCAHFFDTCMGYPLDEQQRRACVMDDDATLVIAGAGSGKTSTMTAKVAYLMKRWHIPSEAILLISFTNASVEEMARRIEGIMHFKIDASKIDAFTFHKLGLMLIQRLSKVQRYNIADEERLKKIVHQFLSGEIGNAPGHAYRVVAEYFAYYFSPEIPAKGTVPMDEYVQKARSVDLETLRSMAKDTGVRCTLKAEKVKSFEEVVIANYLYLNGIEYEYEPEYPKEYESDGKHRQYHPDFFLPDSRIYIEHYGLDANGQPPPFFTDRDKRKYLESLDWKRKLHREHGNKYIETFSCQVHDGSLLNRLSENLRSFGVVFRPRNYCEIMRMISKNFNKKVSEFEKLLSSFITLFKSNNYPPARFDEMMRITSSDYESSRRKTFLAMAKAVYEMYQADLAKSDSIDFNDMINNATALVSSCGHRLPWKYVVVDEYQDISVSRAKLIKAIIKNTGAHLFCVGDDWQSIYRFAGSDISLFVKFGDFFGMHDELNIEKTYRNSQELINVMGAFVQKNPLQKKKQLRSSRSSSSPIVPVVYPSKEHKDVQKNYGKALLYAITDIAKKSGKNPVSVMLLGRTKYDESLLKTACTEDGVPLLQVKGKGIYKYSAYSNLSFRFLTVHKAKGLEDDYVIILNCKNEKLGFPNQIVDDPILNLVLSSPESFEYAEERRLFYVAVTRTRNSTYLLVPEEKESPFALEIAESVEAKKMEGCKGDRLERCPDCHSGVLVDRVDLLGKTFKGCSNYPLCEYTSNARKASPGEKVCPKCGNAMEKKKRNSDGHIFWGCTNFPECRYTEDEDSRGLGKKLKRRGRRFV